MLNHKTYNLYKEATRVILLFCFILICILYRYGTSSALKGSCVRIYK